MKKNRKKINYGGGGRGWGVRVTRAGAISTISAPQRWCHNVCHSTRFTIYLLITALAYMQEQTAAVLIEITTIRHESFSLYVRFQYLLPCLLNKLE